MDIKINTIPFSDNVYQIQIKDLRVHTFPYSKVIQSKYGCRWILIEGKKRIGEVIKKYWSSEEKDFDLAVKSIWEIKEELKNTYPQYFNKRGWYDLKVWRELPGNEEILEKFYKYKEEKKQRKEEKEYWLAELAKEEERKRQELSNKIEQIIKNLGKETFSIHDFKELKITRQDLLSSGLVEKVKRNTHKGAYLFKLKETKDV